MRGGKAQARRRAELRATAVNRHRSYTGTPHPHMSRPINVPNAKRRTRKLTQSRSSSSATRCDWKCPRTRDAANRVALGRAPTHYEKRSTAPSSPQTRNGGRHCCQPPSAPSEGSAGVRQRWRPEGLLLLDPGSPAQASPQVANPNPKTGFASFRGPSWTNPLSRRLSPEGHRVSRKTEWLFRRLFRLVRLEAEASPHRLPVEIGPSAPSSSFVSLPTLRGGWNFRPDHTLLMTPAPSRAKPFRHRVACG